MKAISIKEPWASLIRSGEKPIETRTWSTKYRGKLLLCCSKNPKSELSGMAFAIVTLHNVRDMKEADEWLAHCKVYPRAKSWVLKNIRPIKPFPVKGKLGLFEVDFKHICKEEGCNEEHYCKGYCKSHYGKKGFSIIPAFGKGGKIHIHTMGITEELKPMIKEIRNEVLNDCIKNPSKYLEE